MARWRARVRLEDGVKLDLNELLRDGYGRTGEHRVRSIFWRQVGTGEILASGSLEMEMRHENDARAILQLGKVHQFIRLVREPRRFGGGQWYFVCPSTAQLASVLWLPPGAAKFSSRQTWGRRVAYSSQFQAPFDRALSRAQAIRYRLGGREYLSLLGGQPPKPKGMHWRTYESLLERSQAYEAVGNSHLWAFAQRLKRRLK